MSTEQTSRMSKFLLETVLAGAEPDLADEVEMELEDEDILEVIPAAPSHASEIQELRFR